ncbi:hypothetical protein A0H81_12093 [Grifola frondosa]|uniref:Uncharacterized protein n=1 Tax=Grifola frondosa TaxID=5627 RepID=A0A1C7LTR1_GRIFR|nr:hypothetical protein A0H81_12093 [Grifola frondosa]
MPVESADCSALQDGGLLVDFSSSLYCSPPFLLHLHSHSSTRQSPAPAMNAPSHVQPSSKAHGGHLASITSFIQRIVHAHSEHDLSQSDDSAPDTSVSGRCDRPAALHSTDTSGVAPQVRDGGCAWGGSCVAPLDDQTPAGIQEHLKLYHSQPEWNGNTSTVCCWEGGSHCGHKEMNWGVMGRHIADRHLGRALSA